MQDFGTQGNLMKIVLILDKLGLPTWAGRPACAAAMSQAGITRPDTNVLAQAVKLRKSLYGVVDQYTDSASTRPELPPPTPDQIPAPAVTARELLLNKLRGGEDVREKEDLDAD